MKLTEDEVVLFLVYHLRREGWNVSSYRLGFDKGPDIEAAKGAVNLLVEVKGARAADNAHNKKRAVFDAGQIKSHFGRALVKTLSLKHEFPNAKIAIAHPDDPDIRKHIGDLIRFLKPLGIVHYWVTENSVIVDK